MKKRVCLLSLIMVIPFLSSCELHPATLDEIKRIEKRSLHQNHVCAKLSYKKSENGKNDTQEYVYERHVDGKGQLWIITPYDTGKYYEHNGYACYYDATSAGSTPYMIYNGEGADTFYFDSLVNIYESVNDPDKKISYSNNTFTLTISYELFIEQMFNVDILLDNDPGDVSIKITVSNGLIVREYLRYSVNLQYIFASNTKEYTETIDYKFSYGGKANIPQPVLNVFALLGGESSPIKEFVRGGDNDNSLELSSSIKGNETFDVHYYNLANYNYDIDNFNHTAGAYRVYSDHERYLVAMYENELYVYDIFTLKKLYTVKMYATINNVVCGNGVVAFKLNFGTDYNNVPSKYYFFNLSDFSQIDIHYASFYGPVIADGNMFFLQREGEELFSFNYVNLKTLETKQLIKKDWTVVEKLYLNTFDKTIVYLTIENRNLHGYGYDTRTAELKYSVDSIEYTSMAGTYYWDGRYIGILNSLFDTRNGETSIFNSKEYYVLSREFDFVYRKSWINENYDFIVYDDIGGGTEGSGQSIYDKNKKECVLPIPEAFGYQIEQILDDYYISIFYEIIMIIELK